MAEALVEEHLTSSTPEMIAPVESSSITTCRNRGEVQAIVRSLHNSPGA
jgi:hypothetical protein